VPTELLKLLKDEEAPYQMLLGTALPPDSELDEVLEDGWYSLVRRGGFIRSATYAPGQLKKRTIYMLAPGSCLRRRFKGGMFDLSDNGAHPVWRCGNSLFVGVNL
jgi:CRISPR-associated protein Csm4